MHWLHLRICSCRTETQIITLQCIMYMYAILCNNNSFIEIVLQHWQCGLSDSDCITLREEDLLQNQQKTI